ncbi:MAG TPA: zinc ribbon domain-containing protein [Steroidobacteraceae bacterium]|jgi:putative FmdB family regulatory protein|nr:zinc ribbon domain-containing protein [Steroidobacteraceae bacterium]
MPFYEYECEACKYYAEVMQKISDAPLTRCPSCGKRALKKLVSVPVFRLKGAGWYETDFKSDKETKRNLVGAEKEESKAETKSETPEAKPTAESKDTKDTKDKKEAKGSKPAESRAEKAATSVSVAGRSRAAAPRSAARRPARTARVKRARKKRR